MRIPSLMKLKSSRWLPAGFALMSLAAILGLAGCEAPKQNGVMDAPSASSSSGPDLLPRLAVGDTVSVTLSGPADLPATPEEKPIQSDGTISMKDIGRVQAAGRTPGQLEDDIKKMYVPAYYTHLTVTVQTSSHRVYFVRGEVKMPNQIEYLSPTTVTKAIAAAQDFTDYADRKHVVLIRQDGRRFTLNCRRILQGKDPDPPVFPGDQIEVPRRFY
jgi:polysaccharide export outer membrane protein